MSNNFHITDNELSNIMGSLNTIEANEVTEASSANEAARLQKMLTLFQQYDVATQQSGISKWFVPGTPFGIENCPKHKAFFDAGVGYNERMFCAGNRCLAKGTLIATPGGPRAIEDIVVGDYVYDRNGELTPVIDTWDNGEQEVVDLTNRGKVWATCTPDHGWLTTTISAHSLGWNEKLNVESKVLAKEFNNKHLVNRVYTKSPLGKVDNPTAYALGAFLGDGCCTCGSTNTLVLSSKDSLIPNKIGKILNVEVRPPKKGYSWIIRSNGFELYNSWCRNKLTHEKFVNLDVVKTWNRDSALNFIAGLLDTDGCMSKGKDGLALSFTNQSKSIIDAWCYLVLALWNEVAYIATDTRTKYKNGNVFTAVVRNPHAIKRICSELSAYVVHKYKIDCTLAENIGKRSRAQAVKLTATAAGKVHTYDLTVQHPDHYYLLANGLITSNTGKSIAGSFEASCHATGNYPEWWTGRRFDKPTHGWAAGSTARATRDTAQKELIGPVGAWGTGMIPAELLGKWWALAGVPQGIDIIKVKHVSGGWSTIGFKNYEQPLAAFYGTAMDYVWLDEESPIEHYNECLIRTMTTDGMVFNTFTPLKGLTPQVVRFSEKADYLAGAEKLIGIPEKESEHGDDARLEDFHTSKAIIQAGWDDAPWLTEKAKVQMEADTPPHLRAARRSGKPSMGSGNVFPIAIESILCEPFEIPNYYKRLYALDVGWNCTAVLWAAIDPQTDTLYIYDEYKKGEQVPAVHAHAIRSRGDWLPGVIDPAARGRSQSDGTQLFQQYRDLGLSLHKANNAVDAGITALWQRMTTGNLKVFNNLSDFAKEFVLYRRNLKGNIVKENDHLMDVLRYLQNNTSRAKSKSQLVSAPSYSGQANYRI